MSRVSGLTERVRLMILRGEIPAGGRVVEVQLADRLHIGRSTLREVLRQLQGEGLLVANPSGGMRVVLLSEEELLATLHVRAALEALAATLAAERVRAGDVSSSALRRLDELADAAAAATRGADSALHADRHFHRAVDVLAANDPCHAALDRTWDRIVVAASHAAPLPQRAGPADREHRELLAAIASGDAEQASAVARRHVLATLG